MTRLRGVLGLLGCLVLALTIAVVTPDPTTDVRRRWADADVGAWAQTPDVRARVTSVAVVRSADRGYGEVFTGQGSLVVASVDASVRRQVVLFSHVYLLTADGREYDPRPEFVSAGLGLTQPGFTRHATLVFEVPADRLADAALVLDADAASVDAYADAVRVDLGLRSPVRTSPETVTPPPFSVTTT